MTVNRSVVTIVLILVTFVIVLVHMKDVTTLEYDNLLLANETNAKHRVHTESSIGDHRQGRMSLQAELPSSKAKREQALRSILAARRRQIFSQRPISESRNPNRAPRPFDASAKDASIDVLEAQETRHGMYVTAAAGKPGDEEASGGIDGGEATSSRDVDIEFVSRDEGKRIVEKSSTGNTSLSSLVPNQKSSDTETRGKNTVPMPESLYNYFRPVESNIPVEDMSQFLYFGQKIQPEIQNGTGNNNDTAESTLASAANSRRRYSMKRNFGATTTVQPVARLEEMINEEMNIAVERQTVEKNKVSKMKNAYRGAENGVYYRKARPAEATIASNVIGTGNGTSGGSDPAVENKFRDDNPSAHVDQLRRERGSAAAAAAHVAVETWNASNSTQIPAGQPVSAITRERNGAESEIKLKDRPTDASNKSKPVSSTVNGVNEKPSKVYPRKRKSNDPSYLEDDIIIPFSNPRESLEVEGAEKEGRGIDETSYRRRTTVVACRESNNIETSTSREKLLGRSSTEPFRIAWTPPETSTLRIVVTEGRLGRGSADEYTVEPVVDSTEGRSLDVLPTPTGLAGSRGIEGARWKGRHREQKQAHRGLDEGSGASAREQERDRDPRHREEEQQHQQQHVYAYTITNVTRLLRNYTGPGLSREEQGGREASTGTTEITSGSRRQQPESEAEAEAESQPPPPPPPPLLPPPRGGGAAGIEAGRAPAELSAGTTVEPAAAGGEAAAHLVGERQRKVVVAVGAHQSQQQRAVNRAQLQLTAVNKSGPRSAKTAEAYHPRGGVRWSRAKPRSTEIEGLNDRRFLRKSASAVLNQRVGAGPEGEEDGAVAGKRRRLTNGQSQRRIKGTRNVDEDSDTVNKSGSIAGDERNSRVGARVEDVTVVNGSGEGMTLENTTTVDTTSGVTMQQRVSFAPSVETVVDSTDGGSGGDGGGGGGGGGDPLPTTVNATTTAEGGSGDQAEAVTEAFDTKDETVGRASEKESVVVPSTSTRGIGKSGADNGTENGPPTVTMTAASYETIVAKETTAPLPAPVFPVTPRMIAKAARDPIQTFTSEPTEAPSQITDTKTVAGLVDPSDTEKAYESKDRGITTVTTTAGATAASSSIATTEASTTTTTAATTTTTTTTSITTSLPTVQIEISTIPQDRSATTTTDSKDTSSSTSAADSGDGRRGSGERSPEVRGRNLSDKTQDASTDKDDVLPIMHLYNTSDIFNNTGPVNPFSRGTERRAEHPLPAKQPSEPSRTTEKTSDTVTPRSGENWTRGPDTRRDRHEEVIAASNQVPATGPGRGSSTGNGSGNRTRHRTVYHHPILPEYNTSVYPSELNRTLFETGLISVSPRESVNISEVISKRHDGDAIASQETVAVVSYILATLVVFPIAVGVGLILRRLILRNRKVLEESDTSSEISCRKDALNLENGDFKTSIEKAITKLPRIQHLCHEAEKPPPPSSQESRWEFPRDKLRLQTVLGQGNFGQVWKAEADDLTGHQGTTRLVAVKTVKEGASEREKEDLVRELEIMQQLGSHPNVVTLLGCCTEQEPHYLILEYVMYGKLLAYLRDHRTRQDFYNFSEDSAALTSRDLTVFGYCVARGMEYLASKKIIHRDLAARNVLVDHNKLCKIADFGMSRFADGDGEVIETRHGRNALPIRWMAPESLIYSLFTTKTDVWSFGILMWEIVTLGSTPYPDMTAREVMRNVQNGYRLERPSHCRSELFRVISRCWHADPDRRPEFQTLRRDLAQLLEDNMNGHYVDLESFASECTD
ncbi:mucin-22-like [Apis laboriosa]|uniref:mucin-22-like n=1 Tax=Apis laboriosa TaxID=183418 RepID=UPI001CC768F3|nr:mucin-22-like [Apis laboriosa]